LDSEPIATKDYAKEGSTQIHVSDVASCAPGIASGPSSLGEKQLEALREQTSMQREEGSKKTSRMDIVPTISNKTYGIDDEGLVDLPGSITKLSEQKFDAEVAETASDYSTNSIILPDAVSIDFPGQTYSPSDGNVDKLEGKYTDLSSNRGRVLDLRQEVVAACRSANENYELVKALVKQADSVEDPSQIEYSIQSRREALKILERISHHHPDIVEIRRNLVDVLEEYGQAEAASTERALLPTESSEEVESN
jgi:hypothetical protein